MARCASLRSRAGVPLPIERIVGLEQQKHMIQPDAGDADCNTCLSGDPLDFFGAIRGLVEQSIQPEDIEKYYRQQGHALEFCPVVGSDRPSHSQIVQDLRAENSTLREKESELEQALRHAQDHSHQLLSEVEAALAKANTELSTARDTAARDLSFQISRVRAEGTLAVANSEATIALLGEEFRLFRETAAASEAAGAAQLRSAQEALDAERGQLAALKNAMEEDRQRQAAEARAAIQAATEAAAAAAVSSADETLAKEREGFQKFREEVVARETAQASRLQSLQETLAAEREQASACKQASAVSQRQLEASLAKEREGFRAFRENASGLEKGSEARLRVLEEDLATERERFSALEKANEAKEISQGQLKADLARKESDLAKEREDFRVVCESATELRQESERKIRKLEEDLAAARDQLEALKTSGEASKAEQEEALFKQGAALAKEREARRRAEDTLAAERRKFSESKRASEAKIQLLRAAAGRVEELEDQLATKSLRLKQREAEARALKTDGNVVMGLRESLSCKDNALNELRQELGNLRIASASAEAGAQKNMAPKKPQHKQQHYSSGSSSELRGGNAIGMPTGTVFRREAPEIGAAASAASASATATATATAEEMTRTMSLPSVNSSGEDSGVGPVVEEGLDSDTESSFSEGEDEVSSESEGEWGQEGSAGDTSVEAIGGRGKLYEGKMSIVQEGDEEEEEEEKEEKSGLSDTVNVKEDDASSCASGEGDDEEVELSSGGGQVPAIRTNPENDADGTGTDGGRRSRSPPGLRLNKGDYSEDQEAAEFFVAAKFAAATAEATATESGRDQSEEHEENDDHVGATGMVGRSAGQPSAGGGGGYVAAATRRLSMSHSLSPGPRRPMGSSFRARASVAPGGRGLASSRSLSPAALGKKSRASWSPGSVMSHSRLAPMSNCLSPMVRLSPADHGLGGEGNTVVLELGAWRVRAGVVAPEDRREGEDEEGKSKSYFDDFPCCVARPSREAADLDELVNGASSLAAPMYSKFRETGVFVGGDAWYCCMDHPSIALRSQLRLSCPLTRGTPPTREDTDRLMDHAYGLLGQDSVLAPTLLAYKPTATVDEVLGLASVLLEAHRVPAIRMVNEAQLAALAAGVKTGVIIDIGESGLSVTPIFDGFPVAQAVRSESCGGGDVTTYLDYMLLSRTNEEFNQMTDRRRLEYSREIKEKQCYVPLDFAMEVDEYGAFKRKAMRVCKGAQASPMLSGYEACDSRDVMEEADKDEELTQTQTFTLKSGNELNVKIGRERFHAPEILFQPGLWKEGGVGRSLSEVVLDALSEVDSDTRADMLEDIVVVGGSARLNGLGDRLEEDLKALLPQWMSEKVDVRVPAADELQHRNPISRGNPSAVTVGAEMMLAKGGNDPEGKDWITATQWAETPELLTRALVPFLKE